MADERTWTEGWRKLVEAEGRRVSIEAGKIIPPYHEDMGEDIRKKQAILREIQKNAGQPHYTPLAVERWFKNLPKK